MKHSISLLAILSLIAGIILSGCETPSNKMQDAETSVIEANRDLEIAKSEVEAEIKMYRAKNDERIMEFNRTIGEIKKKLENESDTDVKDRVEEKLAEYEATHRELEREMDNYKATGRENWDDFKDSFSSRMNDLGDSLDDFFTTSGITDTSIN
jgi:basic membrane lipoprotein Med (substrate-binding protein (PBP1-ABC) superfamily)